MFVNISDSSFIKDYSVLYYQIKHREYLGKITESSTNNVELTMRVSCE